MKDTPMELTNCIMVSSPPTRFFIGIDRRITVGEGGVTIRRVPKPGETRVPMLTLPPGDYELIIPDESESNS